MNHVNIILDLKGLYKSMILSIIGRRSWEMAYELRHLAKSTSISVYLIVDLTVIIQ